MLLLNLAALFLYTATAQTLLPNTSSVELQSNITMTVSAHQSGGQCWPGYQWSLQYGGCRHLELEQQTEYAACPAGYAGQRTRAYHRHNHIAQANGHIASDPWVYGTWNDNGCIATPTWDPSETPLVNRIPESLQITYAHGTNFGANAIFLAYLMLHKATGTLWCYAAIESSETGGTLYEYPEEGVFYSQSSPKYQINQCLIQEHTVAFGGENTGYGTITRTAISGDGCTHYFSRTGAYGPHHTPFSNTAHVC